MLPPQGSRALKCIRLIAQEECPEPANGRSTARVLEKFQSCAAVYWNFSNLTTSAVRECPHLLELASVTILADDFLTINPCAGHALKAVERRRCPRVAHDKESRPAHGGAAASAITRRDDLPLDRCWDKVADTRCPSLLSLARRFHATG